MTGSREQGAGSRSRFFNSIFSLLLVIFFLLSFISCKEQKISQSEFVLGTFCTVTLFEKDEQVLSDVFTRLREIDNLFSVNIPSSDISRINAAAGIEPVQVSFEVFQLIIQSKLCAEISGGAFNPAIGPIVSLWDISGNPRVPSQEEIDTALALTDIKDIKLISNESHLLSMEEWQNQKREVFLKKRGMALDLGAVAKGYAADVAAEIIIKAGINRAIIDLGGNIVVIGKNENNRPWRVGIQDPNGERGEYIEVVEVDITEENDKMSIVTSGVYERFFEKDGKQYHHIFSPFTGYPVDNELLSVTIINYNSRIADQLSTAVFVMGYEKGKEFIDSLEGVEAVFIFKPTD